MFIKSIALMLRLGLVLFVATGAIAQSRDIDFQLMKAVMDGNHSHVKRLLQAGADPDTYDESGSSVLMYAASLDEVKIMRELLLMNASVDHTNNEGNTALMWAVYTGKERAVEVLVIEYGANINLRVKRSGACALHIAAVKGRKHILRLLIELGADINAVDEAGVTALMHATARGNVEAVRILVRNGADPKHKNRAGESAISWARERGYVKIVQVLKDAGALTWGGN